MKQTEFSGRTSADYKRGLKFKVFSADFNEEQGWPVIAVVSHVGLVIFYSINRLSITSKLLMKLRVLRQMSRTFASLGFYFQDKISIETRFAVCIYLESGPGVPN